ncbi:hypothetical protein FO519_008603 [Halicephalobus sp. NKZ332]|nr:hypothetical protein FO519_008603 [Halicephalobus sp. NKZ332]
MLFNETWFVPDEYFQCTEVAYGMVYGKAHLSWEWQGSEPLRSVLHPLVVALFYKIYQFLGADSTLAVRLLPNMIHSFLFTISDLFYIKLCNRIFFANPRGKAFTLILYGTNWFLIYCSSRPMGNCVELCLTIIGLNWYPLYLDEINPKTESDKRRQKNFVPYIVIGAISILIRPTAALIWGVLGLRHLYQSKNKIKLILTAIPSLLIPIFISILMDSNFQTPLKFPLLSFAKFNFFSGGSAHFGVHPWYWYFVDGLFLTSTGTYFLATVAAFFFCRIHQRGTLDAAKDIAKDISTKNPNTVTHIVHLMPCYSMPQYAYFHKLKVRHHMLDCTPNLKHEKNYEEESEIFHQDPVKFFIPSRTGKYLMHKHAYVVIYKKTYQRMASVLKDTGYRVWRTYQHTPVPASENQDTVVLVLKRSADAT